MLDKIVCFGKNYMDHMLELGDKPVTKPVIFLKPASVLDQCENWGGKLSLNLTEDISTHYECELVIKLKHGAYQMDEIDVLTAIDSVTVGLDMTLRDRQAQLKRDGHPWTTAKVFPHAAIIGPWIKFEDISDNYLDLIFSFSLNGEVKQETTGSKMLFKPLELIQYASKFFPLCTGDILFTGTPSGVGVVSPGDTARLSLANYQYELEWH